MTDKFVVDGKEIELTNLDWDMFPKKRFILHYMQAWRKKGVEIPFHMIWRRER